MALHYADTCRHQGQHLCQPEQAQHPRRCSAAAGELFLRQLIARVALRVAKDMQQPSAGLPATGYTYSGDAVDGQARWLTPAPAQMMQGPSKASQPGGQETLPSQRPFPRYNNPRSA